MSSESTPGKFNSDRFARSLAHSLLTKILMMLLRLARNAIVARVLGPTDRGILALITSIPEILMTIGNLGYSNAAAYHLGRQGSDPRQIMGAVLLFVVVMGTLCATISFWVVESPWLLRDEQADLSPWRWLIALAIPLFLIKTINLNLILVRDRVGQVNWINLNESLLPLVFFLLLWGVLGLDALMAGVYSWFLALLILALWSIGLLRDCLPPGWSREVQKALLSYGVRGQFDTLFQKLLLRIDYLFVSGLVGATALGYYAMASAAAELLLILPNAISLPLYSFLMRNHQDDKRAVTPMVLRIMLFMMTLGAIALWLIGEWLIILLFGEAFRPAYAALVWLLPGMVALGYCSLIRLDLLGENRPGSVSFISGTCVLINALLNLVLTPLYGIEGAAAASTLVYIIAAIALAVLHRRVTGIPTHEGLLIRGSDVKDLLAYARSKAKR